MSQLTARARLCNDKTAKLPNGKSAELAQGKAVKPSQLDCPVNAEDIETNDRLRTLVITTYDTADKNDADADDVDEDDEEGEASCVDDDEAEVDDEADNEDDGDNDADGEGDDENGDDKADEEDDEDESDEDEQDDGKDDDKEEKNDGCDTPRRVQLIAENWESAMTTDLKNLLARYRNRRLDKRVMDIQGWVESYTSSRVFFYRKDKGEDSLNIEEFPVAGSHDWRIFAQIKTIYKHEYALQRIPLATFGPKSKHGTETFQYFHLSFFELHAMMKMLAHIRLGICTVVIKDMSAHIYFDFDLDDKPRKLDKAGEHSARLALLADLEQTGGRRAVAQELNELLPPFFKRVFGRDIDLGVVQWEDGSVLDEDGRYTKLSLHHHIVSESFVDNASMKSFVEAFVDAHPDSRIARIVDRSVYDQNRNMKIVGSRKAGRQPLAVYDPVADKVLPLDDITHEHIFNSLISYSHTTTHDLLEYKATEGAAKRGAARRGGARKKGGAVKAVADGAAKPAPDGAAKPAADGEEKHEVVVDPNARYAGWTYQEIVDGVEEFDIRVVGPPNNEGGFFNVRNPKGRPRKCLFSDETHVRNNPKLWHTDDGVWGGCHDPHHAGMKKLLLAPKAELPMYGGRTDVDTMIEIRDAWQRTHAAELAAAKIHSESRDATVKQKGLKELARLELQLRGELFLHLNTKMRLLEARPSILDKDLGQEDRPKMEVMLEIHRRWEAKHTVELTKARADSKSRDSATKERGHDELAALEGSLYKELVRYLNKYLMAITRSGRAHIIEDIVGRDPVSGKLRYEHIFFDKRNFLDVKADWKLPGIKHTIAEIWFAYAERRKVDNVIFVPRPEEHIEQNEYPSFNLYRGAGVTRAQAKRWADAHPDWLEHLQPWLDHVEHILCCGNKTHTAYLLGWVASVVQKPWVKTSVGVVLQGQQGSGKSLFVDGIGQIVGTEHYLPVHDPKDVLGDYTHLLRACILLFMDESLWAGDKASEQQLKKLITQPQHRVHEKFLSSVMVASFLNLIFATNNDWAVPVEASDRRFFALTVDDKYAGPQTAESKAYFDKLYAVPIEAIAHYLYEYSLADFNPRVIPATELQRDQKFRSFDPLKKWWHNVLSHGEINTKGWRVRDYAEPIELDDVRPRPKLNEGEWEDWMRPRYKEQMYHSYRQSLSGTRAFVIDQGQFWKNLRKLVPEFKESRYVVEDANGKDKARAVVVYLPSLDSCQRHWRERVVLDDKWEFDTPNDEGPGQGQPA